MLAWNLLVLKQTQKQPWTSGANAGVLLFDISWALCGFNKQSHNSSKFCVFCKYFLLLSSAKMGVGGGGGERETPIPDFRPKGVVREYGLWHFCIWRWGSLSRIGGTEAFSVLPGRSARGLNRNLKLPDARALEPTSPPAPCGRV